jgi:hypothetical protein
MPFGIYANFIHTHKIKQEAKMRVLLIGVFAALLVFAFSTDLPADENNFFPFPGLSALNNYAFLNGDIEDEINGESDPSAPSAGEDKWVFQDISTGMRLGMGFLNMFFGIGSFIMGDVDGGLEILFRQVIGVGIPALFVAILYPMYSSADGMGVIDETGLIGFIFVLPVMYVLVPVGIVLGIYAVSSLITSWVYGFRRPFLYQKPVSTANLNDVRNWNVGLLPDSSGRLNAQIAFTAHF